MDIRAIVEKLETEHSIIWPISKRSKLTKDKLILGIERSILKNKPLHETLDYKSYQGFNVAISKLSINKPKQLEWRNFILNSYGYKYCKTCADIKLLDEFYDDKRYGKQGKCKSCISNGRYNIGIILLGENANCYKCGYNSNFSALELHHINTNIDKPTYAINSNPAQYIFGCSNIETAKERYDFEKSNLKLLCRNCHQKEHFTSNIDTQSGLKSALICLYYEYKCNICDENIYLHLHHNNIEEKIVSFGSFQNLSKDRILKDKILEREMKKDVLILCGNHHREIHNPTYKLNNLGEYG